MHISNKRHLNVKNRTERWKNLSFFWIVENRKMIYAMWSHWEEWQRNPGKTYKSILETSKSILGTWSDIKVEIEENQAFAQLSNSRQGVALPTIGPSLCEIQSHPLR